MKIHQHELEQVIAGERALSEEEREWCAREADRAGEGAYHYVELIKLNDKELARNVLYAWTDYVISNCL